MNQCIIHGKQPTKTTKTNYLKIIIKNLKTEKLKPQTQKIRPTTFQLLLIEAFNKTCRDQKKDLCNQSQDCAHNHNRDLKSKSSIMVIKVNILKSRKSKKEKKMSKARLAYYYVL